MPFMASVLQALHPVLPNSLNGYVPRLGIRVELGGTPGRDLRSGVPRFSFETTVDFTLTARQRLHSAATLRLLSGGNPDKIARLGAQSPGTVCLSRHPVSGSSGKRRPLLHCRGTLS